MTKPKPRGRNGGRKPLVAGGSVAWLRLRLPAADLQAIKQAAKAAKQTLTAYVRQTLQKP